MIFSRSDIAVWALNIGLNAILVAITWNESQCPRLPIFRLFLKAALVKSLVLVAIAMHGDNIAYFYGYWTMQLVMLPFYLGVVFEVFSDLFKPFWTVPRGPMLALLSAIVAMESVAVYCAAFHPGSYADELMSICHASERALMVIISSSIAFTFLFARYFRMSWRRETAGVAAGIFLFTAVRVAVVVFQSGAGIRALINLRAITLVTYMVTEVVWITTFLRHTGKTALAPNEVEQLRSGSMDVLEAMEECAHRCEYQGVPKD